jgi:hypothetical protein
MAPRCASKVQAKEVHSHALRTMHGVGISRNERVLIPEQALHAHMMQPANTHRLTTNGRPEVSVSMKLTARVVSAQIERERERK